MDIFDFFSMVGEIVEFFKAAGEDIGNVFNKKKTKQSHFANREADEGWTLKELGEAYSNPEDDPGERYWQDRFNQHLDQKERDDAIVSEMIIKDDEARHQQSNDEQENTESGEELNSGEQETDSGAFESDSSFESGDYDSDGSGDGYIG